MKHFLLFCFIASISFVNGQLVEGVDLNQYPAQHYELKEKAAIRWNTNPFKNKIKEIKEGYANNEISFAGFYITVLWQKGLDTVQGVMIDSRNGIIHRLPIYLNNCSNKCMDIDDIFDRYLFLPTSNLFVTSTCKKVKVKNENKVRQEFYFYLWNESAKKFSLMKQTQKERP